MPMLILTFDGSWCYCQFSEAQETRKFERNVLVQALSYFDAQIEFANAHRGTNINPYKSCFDKARDRFPTGLLPKAVSALRDRHIVFDWKPLIPMPAYQVDDSLLPDWLAGYQRKMVDLGLRHYRGILQSPTSSGKSYVIAYLARHFLGSVLIVCDKKDLLANIKTRVEQTLDEPVGEFSGRTKDLQRVSCALIGSLTSKKAKENRDLLAYLKSAEALIVDEAHRAGSASFRKLSGLMPGRTHSLGVTATAFRERGDGPVMEGVLGPVLYKLEEKDVASQGRIMDPQCYFYYIEHPVYDDCPSYRQVVKTPSGEEKVQYDTFNGKPIWAEVYRQGIVHNDRRNRLVVDTIDRFLDLPDRTGSVLCLVKLIEHGEILSQMAEEAGVHMPFIDGSVSQQEREDKLEELRSGKLQALCASSILNEGVDIPSLEMVVIASGGASARILVQQVGRVLRTAENKKRAVVVDFFDDEAYYLGRNSSDRFREIKRRFSKKPSKVASPEELVERL